MVCALMMENVHAMLHIWERRVTFQNVQIIVHIQMGTATEKDIDVFVQMSMQALIASRKLRMGTGRRSIQIQSRFLRQAARHMAVRLMAIQCL